MSKGGGEQTTTSEPWAELQPYLLGRAAQGATDGYMDENNMWVEGNQGSGAVTGMLPEAQRLYDQGASQYYPNQTYANFDPAQQQSQQMGMDYAQSGLGGILDPTMSSFKNVVSGGLMSPDSNPYMRQNIASMADQVKQNMALSGISGNEDAAQSAGQYGSSRHGLADYLTRKSANETIAQNTNDMLSGGYNTGLNAMMLGFNQAPQMAELGMAPSNLMNTIGRERQGMAQQGINESMNRFNYGQSAPWQNLNNLSSVLQGNYMGSGGQQTVPTTGSNPLGSMLGGASTGAGIFSALGPAAGASAMPWLAGGAALGLLGNR